MLLFKRFLSAVARAHVPHGTCSVHLVYIQCNISAFAVLSAPFPDLSCANINFLECQAYSWIGKSCNLRLSMHTIAAC